MPVKRFGIFLAYPPTTELRGEGLGRHLAYLLKGAAARDDIRMVVACPSWTVDSLRALCEAEQVPIDSFDLLAVPQLPISLRLQAMAKALFARLSRPRAARPRLRKRLPLAWGDALPRFLLSTRNAIAFVLALVVALPLAILAAIVVAAVAAVALVARPPVAWLRARMRVPFERELRTIIATIRNPGSHPFGRAMYRVLEASEADLLIERIHGRQDIAAWYCPTAFWPQFNAIDRPRVVCVPDVVLTRLPIAFALATGSNGLDVLERIRETIAGAPHFITYSEDVRWRTLVDEFGCDPGAVHVIRHGNNDLSSLIRVEGTPDDAAATVDFCRVQLADALVRSTNAAYAHGFANRGFRFIFCPTQARPNKNLLTLLVAYEHLLRVRGLPHKLVLTADLDGFPQARDFVEAKRLGNDVLSLRNLSVRQLAACYALADVAVNPSLFEGGCPFTLTEALSVGTPALLARIAVAEESIRDERLSAAMLFDPYDWEALSERIEWALGHRADLLALQREGCRAMLDRRWADVADDYLALLERIAAEAPAEEAE